MHAQREAWARAEAVTAEAEIQTRFITAGSLLYAVEHRPWLPPDGPWLLSQNWNDSLFAHYAIQPRAMRELVPHELTLDLYDGWAWLTVAAFSVSHVRPSGVPPIPGLSFFPQVSLRTYVSAEKKPGLFYLSVDAGNLSAVWFARMFYRMQYWHAKIAMSGGTVQRKAPEEKAIRFHSRRLHGPAARNGAAEFSARYEPTGDPTRAGRGTLESFLAERYCVYSWHKKKTYRTEVHHQPWALQEASVELEKNTMGEPLGLDVPDKPQLWNFSRSQKMLIWAPERVRTS